MKIAETITMFLALTSLAAGGCDPEAASEASEDADVPALLGLGDDWTPAGDGTWERALADGTIQHLGLGAAGKREAVAALVEVGARLADVQQADPTPEHEAQLAEHAEHLAAIEAETISDEDLLVRLRGCVLSTNITAHAGPAASGTTANASAGYFNNCDGIAATVRTYAIAKAGYVQSTQTCEGKTGTSVSCTASVTTPGTSNCFSHSDASISRGALYVWQDNWSCGGGGGGGGGGSGSGGGSGPDCPKCQLP